MIVEFRNLIPFPVQEIHHNDSDIWEKSSFSFEAGKYYYLHAPSGKGKTTLLSVIYGIRKDFSGKLLIDGKAAGTIKEKEWSRIRKTRLSYIFQGLELFNELTAMENILLKNRQMNFRSQTEILNMAKTLEMESFMERKTGLLSFGQQQRVAIIRALCQPYKFLLADEAFSHLDKTLARKAFAMIKKDAEKQGSGMFFTSLEPETDFRFDEHYMV